MLAPLVSSAQAAAAPAWSIQPTPVPVGATSSVLAGISCSSRATCVAVGHFTDRRGRGMPLAERWNGNTWSIQRTPAPAGARASLLFAASCAEPTACTAVGSTTNRSGATVPFAERWNGSRWSIQHVPALAAGRGHVSYLGGVSCPSRTYCTAVGYSGNAAGSRGVTLVERWDANGWSVQATPRPAGAAASFLNAVTCVSPRSCTAVGFFNTHSGIGGTLGERWNGRAWSLQRTPTPEGAVAVQLVGVSCTAPARCIAAGYFAIVTGIDVMLAERWSGGKWSIQRTLYPDHATGVEFAGVSCASRSACTAVGFFGDPNGLDEPLAERWNGTHWVIQKTPSPSGAMGSTLAAVSCPATTTCTAVGSFTNAAGNEVTLAERYARTRG